MAFFSLPISFILIISSSFSFPSGVSINSSLLDDLPPDILRGVNEFDDIDSQEITLGKEEERGVNGHLNTIHL